MALATHLSPVALAMVCIAGLLPARPGHAADTGVGIQSPASKAVLAPFHVVQTRIRIDGNVAVFQMAVSGQAGSSKTASGGLSLPGTPNP